MSFQFSKAAWLRAVPGRNAGAKLVLICLADQANDQGECWSSQWYIAQRTGLSTRRVRSNLKFLAELGLITITRRRAASGVQISSLYRLIVPADSNAETSGRKRPSPPDVTSYKSSFQSNNEKSHVARVIAPSAAFDLPEWLRPHEKLWHAYLIARRYPVRSQAQADALISKLKQLSISDDTAQLLEIATAGAWGNFFPVPKSKAASSALTAMPESYKEDW